MNASGTWNIPASNLAVGSHSFTATDTDAAGNTSVKSAPLAVTIDASSAPPPPVDTTAPAQPKISSFSPDSAPTSDGHTTATTLTLSGAGEANSTIQVFDGTNSIGTAPVNSNMRQQIELLDRTIEGQYLFAEDRVLARIPDPQGLGGALGVKPLDEAQTEGRERRDI